MAFFCFCHLNRELNTAQELTFSCSSHLVIRDVRTWCSLPGQDRILSPSFLLLPLSALNRNASVSFAFTHDVISIFSGGLSHLAQLVNFQGLLQILVEYNQSGNMTNKCGIWGQFIYFLNSAGHNSKRHFSSSMA